MEQRKIELLMRARQGRGRQNQPQADRGAAKLELATEELSNGGRRGHTFR